MKPKRHSQLKVKARKHLDHGANIRKRREHMKSHHGKHRTLSELKQFLASQKPLNEEAQIRSYSPQALGRKRNMFLHATALDGDAFAAWVRDRLYRIAYDNQKSVSDFTPKDIEMGLNKWEDSLRQGDKDFGKYLDQFRLYTHRFMDVAKALMNKGDESMGVKPSKAPAPSVEGAPSSPKLLRYKSEAEGGPGVGTVLPFGAKSADALQSGGGGRGPEGEPQVGPDGQPISPEQAMMMQDPSLGMGFTPQDEMFLSYIETMQSALELDDENFMLHVEDTILNSQTDPFMVSQEQLEAMMNEDFESLMAQLPPESLIKNSPDKFEKIFEQYKSRFLKFAERTLEKVKEEELQGPKPFLPIVKYNISDVESAFIYGFVSSVNPSQPLMTTNLTLQKMNAVKKNPGLMTSGRQMAMNLAQMYPLIAKSYIYAFAGVTEESEISEDWPLYNAYSNTNLIFQFQNGKVFLSRNKLKTCPEGTLNRECSTKIKSVLLVDEVSFPLGPKQEARLQLNQALMELHKSDYIFDTPYDIQKRMSMHGVEQTLARQQADMIFTHKQSIMQSLSAFFLNPISGILNEKYITDALERSRSEAKKFVQLYFNEFKDIVSEFLCRNIKGEGKFKSGSDALPNTMIVGNSFGSAVMMLSLNDELFDNLANMTKCTVSVFNNKLTKQNYLERYMNKFVTKEEDPETIMQKSLKERPFTINTLYEMILPEIQRINAVMVSGLNSTPALHDVLSEEIQGYLDSALRYASFSFSNFMKFFDIELEGIKFDPINIYETLTGKNINKEKEEEDEQ